VVDPIFSEPRLAAIYDQFDGERDDLDLYVGIIDEVGATAVLDLGCGTGSLASALRHRNVEVIGIDPALASLDTAKSKPGAERVRWIHGTAQDAPTACADIAVMTGNVAQVFITDDEWIQTLAHVHRALHEHGWLVFETRDPARKAWEDWTPETTYQVRQVDGIGEVIGWTELTTVPSDDADPLLVSFRHHYRFDGDDTDVVSESTLRFRTAEQIEADLARVGFAVRDIRDAPDRPGRELVFIAQAQLVGTNDDSYDA
jgi:SAM-dependent methyltransferase